MLSLSMSGPDLLPGPVTFSLDDMMSWCIVMSSDMITSRKLDSSVSVKYISYHRHCLWWLHDICFCLIISSLPPPPALLSEYTCLWSGSVVATPRQLIASPVSQWTTPLSAQRLQFLILKNRCCFPRPLPSQFSNQESGVRTVVRCINSAQADLAQPLEFYIFSPKIC